MSVRKKRILLVDDEANPDPSEFVVGNYLTYYETRLTDAGFDVQVAQSDQEAMRHMTESDGDFDLVILDLHFPTRRGTGSAIPNPVQPEDYAGVIFARWVKQQKIMVPIVVLTNVTDVKVTDSLRNIEAVKCILFKHICTPRELVDLVKCLV